MYKIDRSGGGGLGGGAKNRFLGQTPNTGSPTIYETSDYCTEFILYFRVPS